MPTSADGSIHFDQSIIPFATALHQDTITVAGQDLIAATSTVLAQVQGQAALNNDWLPAIISNIVPGVSFDITARLAQPAATRQGSVRVHWMWF